ncbi:hypothetical protein KR009_003290 [Drosophila setifemur]|nr:hypothetical protein KR009_003290 [Drosophila setifemur]
MGSPWYLEHVSTHEKYILHNGDNMMGRHSSCRIVWSYVCVSREHAKMIVNSEGVVVQSMKALNGVYIDGQKVERMPVIEGSIISLGVEELPDVVPRSYPIFKLKKMVSSVEEIVLSSDDDDTRPLPPVKLSSDSKEATEFNLSKSSNFDMKNEKDSNLDEAPCCSSSNLHLPKLPELKQELVMTTTQEIRNIFGEADEAILGSVLDINPYLYNKLNNDAGGIGRSGEKIHDGDSIELDSDADNAKMPPPTMPEQKKNDEEEYDERFAMSQAVLQELKAEMAFSDGEEDFLGANGMNNVDLGSPSSQLDDDDIIIISDNEDDELYDKVADWSTKLFSQKAPDVIQMSQVYPLDDSGSDQESGSTIKKRSSPRVLRIDSSSGSSSDDLKDVDVSKEKGKDAEQAKYPDASMTANVAPPSQEARDSLKKKPKAKAPRKPSARMQTRSKSCYEELLIETAEPMAKQNRKESNNYQKELVVTLCAVEDPKNIQPVPSKTVARIGQRRKTIDTRLELEKPISKTNEPKKDPKAKESKNDTAIKKGPSARLLNRSKSCYMERPIPIEKEDEPLNIVAKKNNQKKTNNYQKELVVTLCAVEDPKNVQPMPSKTVARIGERRKTIDSRLELEKPISKTNEPKKDPKAKESKNETSIKKGPSARLLNRSKSCYMERPIPIAKEDEPLNIVAKKNVDARSVRVPSVIEASFLPKQCGKLRGVSAQKTDKDKEKLKVLERQRFVDYQKDMKTKWFQKPKDKKKDDKVIKDNRRDALKKLSDKPKEKEISGSGSRKRKHTTSVPTVKGSNRGGFLTCGVEGPPPKMAKKENVKPPTPPTKKTIPKRRSTIETFTQQLQAADEAIINPQPHCSRPSERKEAEKSRNQRTCNRVNFADMERYRNVAEKMKKKLKRVRFNDNVEIHYIERAKGARSNVQGRKECVKIFLSTYRERREWTLNRGKQVNDIRQHSRSILRWGNQWLKHRSVEAVANADVLMPVPHDFESFKQYREIFVPLMKLELLTTIERDYNSSKTTFDVSLKNVYCEDNYYRLVTRVNSRPFGKFVLYTLSGGNELPETFANLLEQKGIGGNAFDLTFEILKQDIPMEKINSLKHLTARPVVDSLRVELGALSAVHQLSRSPLCRRVLKPTEAVQVNSLPKEAFAYKGYSSLNEHQEDICLRIYQRVVDDANPSVTLIQGPPGTGKSMVISNLSLQCMYGKAAQLLDRKILICSHSNTAVDHIVGALSAVHRVMTRSHFMMLRFGLYDKMSMQSRHFSLEAHFRRAKEEKLKRLSVENIEVLKKQQADLKAEIQKLLEKPNLKSTYLQQQLHHKEKQLQLISDQLNPPLTQREEFDIAKMCVGRAHIVCTTLSSCVKLANYVDFFDLCIIDEATQCTEPWTLLPMRFGLRHLVLVGDTQQLPAVVLSQKAIDFGLANSMFDRIQRSLQKHLDQPVGHQLVHTKLFKLSKQYRMHPEICRWPNKYFYEDQLVNSGCTVRVSPIIPYCVINLSYTRDNSGTGNKSISNNEEAHFVAQLLTEMDKHMPSTRYSYGLISPYNNQCYALSQVIPSNMKLTPLTVDAFQGLEKDVIIISNARTRGCGFLTNYQRLNVALTRPKRCLVICGNFDDLQTVDMWRQLLDDARQRKVYFDLKREHVADLKNSLINKLLVKPHISEHPKK